jgi:hypothetical protein
MEQGKWEFPMKGYDISAMKKKDYRPGAKYGPYNVKGYNFFDGNRHGGHPAYDIMILDKDQDCLDDTTGKPVEVVAMTDAVVISFEDGWLAGSKLRGGNYIWLCNPSENKFFYYAHLKDISVKLGEFVYKGQTIGTVGRTGYTASNIKSPTHLHLMVLEYKTKKLKSFDYYNMLK